VSPALIRQQLRIVDRAIAAAKARLIYLVEQKAYLQAELLK
jgi:hypothetical protein